MAEERNPVSTSETDEIKSEIHRARVEMSETIGEIQERLRPDHLIQQAKDSVTEAATGKMRNIMYSAGEKAAMVADQTKYAGRNVSGYVRTHPIQMAIVAGAATWWLLRNSSRSRDWQGASEGWHDTSELGYDDGRSLTGKVGEYASTARETVGEYASTARETAGEYASTARETVGEYAGSAREQARRASERVRTAASSASRQAQQRLRQADDWVHEYPLAAGALAVAVGAAIGLAVPATEIENRTMGETRDQAWEKAAAAARELRDKASEKVQNVAETVMDVTSSAVASPGSTAEPTTTGRV